MKFFIIIVSVAAISFGCAPSSSDPTAYRDPLDNYRRSSCEYNFSSGGTSVPTPDEVSTVYFDKKLEFNHVRAIFTASGAQTINYIQTVGNLKVWRSGEYGGGCRFFSALEQAPLNFQDVWSKAADEDKSGALLGLYFAKNHPKIPGQQPTILVRDDTDRWTIVHEFMHHLFEVYRDKNGQPESEMYEKFQKNAEHVQKLAEALNSPETIPAEAKLKMLSDIFEGVARNFEYIDFFITQIPLEEMSIETLIMKNYDNFKYLAKNFASSAAYVNSNGKKAEHLLKEQIANGEELLKGFTDDPEVGLLNLDVARLRKGIDQLKVRLEQMKVVRKDALDAYSSNTHKPNLRYYNRRLDLSSSVGVVEFHEPSVIWEKVRSTKLPKINFRD